MTLSVITIIFSGIANMIADILLVSGKDYKNKQQDLEDRVRRTPEKHILMSGLLGCFSILFWLTPIYYLARIPNLAGTIAFISFAMYIVSLAVFHVAVSYITLCFKMNKSMKGQLLPYIKRYGVICILLSAIYTGTMIYLAFTGTLVLLPWHFLTLPFFSIILIQFILGNLLSFIPHFTSVSGTLGMMISFLSTLHIMAINSLV